MIWNLAIKTLLHDRGKLVAGLVGVIFSVVLVNTQGGLFLGLMRKASLLVDRGQADIWVGHRGMHNVDFPHQIPLRWIDRVRSVPGVKEATPMKVEYSQIEIGDGQFETVVVVGVERGSKLGHAFTIVDGDPHALSRPDGIIVDQCDADKLNDPRIGEAREIGGHQVRIAGHCHGVLSFLVAPYVFTTRQHCDQICGSDPGMTSYFLVKVSPDANRQVVRQQIQERLPDTTVMMADEFASTSVSFWMKRTGIGLSFGAATLLGLMVGLVMVAQTLYAMALDRIGEFATLKAIGATEHEILRILASQATLIALFGSLIGTGVSLILAHLLSTPRSEIYTPLVLNIGSVMLVGAICWFASLVPYLRIRRVDPHLALQG